MNEQNLKPFQKGQSGNPNGRPKKLPALETLLNEILTETDENTGMTRIERIIRTAADQAQQGDTKSFEYLMNRVYGKSNRSIGLLRENDLPDIF